MSDDRITTDGATAPLHGGIALLERAISYTLGSLHLVTPAALHNPTPCRDWDLRALLAHLDDSLAALHEAIDVGRIGCAGEDPVTDLAVLRSRACELLGAWNRADADDEISVAGAPVTSSIVSSAGAVEIAVHGWDVARACGRHRPIPAGLAEEMLDLAPLFVTGADRPARFARPVDPPPPACPGDRLVAFLGRLP